MYNCDWYVQTCRFIDGPPGVILAEQFACKARLVLHFDINKTIIMTDKAQESDMTQMINMLLSECAWGRLEPGPMWVPVGRLATDRCRHLALSISLSTHVEICPLSNFIPCMHGVAMSTSWC